VIARVAPSVPAAEALAGLLTGESSLGRLL
jgi:hypothetical protein